MKTALILFLSALVVFSVLSFCSLRFGHAKNMYFCELPFEEWFWNHTGMVFFRIGLLLAIVAMIIGTVIIGIYIGVLITGEQEIAAKVCFGLFSLILSYVTIYVIFFIAKVIAYCFYYGPKIAVGMYLCLISFIKGDM